MKKVFIAILGCLFFSTNVFAVATDTSSENLEIGGAGDPATADLVIGLSPKVVGHYFTDGDSTTTAQWYAIATVHPGGNIAYGTGQDINNIYMDWFVTGSDATTAVQNVPDGKSPTDSDGDGVADGWGELGWSLTPPTGPDEN